VEGAAAQLIVVEADPEGALGLGARAPHGHEQSVCRASDQGKAVLLEVDEDGVVGLLGRAKAAVRSAGLIVL
jgi:hypothetical protein